MNFLNKKEQKKTKVFLEKGYIISKVESMSSLKYISLLISNAINQQVKKKLVNLNKTHEKISIE